MESVLVSGVLRVCLVLSRGVHGECACEWKYAYTKQTLHLIWQWLTIPGRV